MLVDDRFSVWNQAGFELVLLGHIVEFCASPVMNHIGANVGDRKISFLGQRGAVRPKDCSQDQDRGSKHGNAWSRWISRPSDRDDGSLCLRLMIRLSMFELRVSDGVQFRRWRCKETSCGFLSSAISNHTVRSLK